MIDKIRRFMRRKQAYDIFNTEQGQRVLADLCILCKYRERIHGERECGRRDVIVHILHMLNIDESEINRRIKQQQEDME